MPTKWCMTVGYPGGEFAVKCEAAAHFTTLKPYCEDINAAPGQLLTRECPPDLAEWLSAPMHTYNPDRQRMKVPGGWLYAHRVDVARAFVPVAGTANITVLEVRDAD